MLTKFHPARVFACTPEGGGELSRLYWAVTTSSSYLCWTPRSSVQCRMPSIVRLTLQRSQPSPWGLRLQGGADFEKALVISQVTEGSPSHTSGLRVRLTWEQCEGEMYWFPVRRCTAGDQRSSVWPDDPQECPGGDNLVRRCGSSHCPQSRLPASWRPPGLETLRGGSGSCSSESRGCGGDLHQDQPGQAPGGGGPLGREAQRDGQGVPAWRWSSRLQVSQCSSEQAGLGEQGPAPAGSVLALLSEHHGSLPPAER